MKIYIKKYQEFTLINSIIPSFLSMPLKKEIPHKEKRETIICNIVKPSPDKEYFHFRVFC